MASLVKDLIEAGIHFGHRSTNWNPKMAPFIFGKRNKIHIIDVKATIKGLLLARKYIAKTVAEGKDEDWETMFQTNVLGLLRMTRAALPLLVSQPDCGEQALEITDMLVRSNAVDVIVVDPDQKQTCETHYDPAISGEVRRPLAEFPPVPWSPEKVIARRAAQAAIGDRAARVILWLARRMAIAT